MPDAEPIVATPVEPEFHTPPATVSVNDATEPTQTTAGPVMDITEGDEKTVT